MAKSSRTSTRSPRRRGPAAGSRVRANRRRLRAALWLLGGLVFVGVAALLILLARAGSPRAGGEGALTGSAPDFTLPRLDGEPVSLSSYRGQRNVLLFFNEGYGCPPCWQQARELQDARSALEAAGTELLVVVVDPPDLARQEAQRWGLSVPILLDQGGQVSRAYKTLGFGMHANKPNHTFVFVDIEGQVRWWKDYASMYAPTDQVVQRVQSLGQAGSP